MPAPLDPHKREAIEQAIRDGGTCGAIATQHGVSRSTVSKIGKQLEAQTGSPAFERSQTKRACADRKVDLVARRAELAELLMGDAFKIRERSWEEQEEYFGSMAGPVRVWRQTNAREFKDFATAVGILIDKVDTLTRDDADGLAAVDAWLKSLTGL